MPARRSDGEGQKAAPAMAESRSQEDAAQAAFKQRREDAIDGEKKDTNRRDPTCEYGESKIANLLVYPTL